MTKNYLPAQPGSRAVLLFLPLFAQVRAVDVPLVCWEIDGETGERRPVIADNYHTPPDGAPPDPWTPWILVSNHKGWYCPANGGVFADLEEATKRIAELVAEREEAANADAAWVGGMAEREADTAELCKELGLRFVSVKEITTAVVAKNAELLATYGDASRARVAAAIVNLFAKYGASAPQMSSRIMPGDRVQFLSDLSALKF